ncbi:uncharacterized protein H6S33_001876 [Morchella sextelata]|uniref:uncharacterized protein n=1 Tax=Morchella sextelata TaxID=1174677 RepID=UPI001D04A5AA|nr:uncharacterized protein H6S33_001876 [Morchella sextelata]KAH0608742.1 hypothetical protein H6S33_001876 [Morchella sextelata]
MSHPPEPSTASPSIQAPKRRIRAPPPKNCSCVWCGAVFTKSGLGRHYDQWVYAVSPARPDDKHTEEAISQMRNLRHDVRRLRGMKHMDPKEKKSLQNRRNYERHQEQQVEKKRVKRIADMARSMVFKELAKEVEEIKASASLPSLPHFTPGSELTPTSPHQILNFATLAYHFLPAPPTLFTPVPLYHTGTWNVVHPDIHEYTALYTLFRNSPLSTWSPRLNEEWTRWQPLDDNEKKRLALQELGREFARKGHEIERLTAYAELWETGKSLEERAKKWEERAAMSRELYGRAEEVQLTTELDRMWSSRDGAVAGGSSGATPGVGNGQGDVNIPMDEASSGDCDEVDEGDEAGEADDDISYT